MAAPGLILNRFVAKQRRNWATTKGFGFAADTVIESTHVALDFGVLSDAGHLGRVGHRCRFRLRYVPAKEHALMKTFTT